MLPESVMIPSGIQRVVSLSDVLDAVTEENSKNSAKKIVVELKYYQDVDELVSNILAHVNVRNKGRKQYSKLCKVIYDSLGKNFKDRLSEKASKLFIRDLFLEGVFCIDEIKEKCKKDMELYFYFAPEIEIPEDTFLYCDMNYIEDNFELLKQDDYKLYKELLEYGHLQASKEYCLKYNEFERLQTEFSEINPNDVIVPSMFEADHEISLLSFAAYYGSYECFMYLMQKDGSVTNQVLQNAAKGGNMKIVEYLEQQNQNFENAILSAIEFHRNDVFHHFVQKYDKAEASFNDCISLGNIVAYGYYLQNGSDPDEIDCYGWSSLPLAAMNAQLTLCKYLVEKGCNLNAIVISNNTALHYACSENNYLLAKYLIEKGCDINAVDMGSQTPLHIAAQKGSAKIAHLLISKGADIAAEDEDGYSPENYMSLSIIESTSIEEEDFSYKNIFDEFLEEPKQKELSSKEGNEVQQNESACCLLI